MADDEPRGSPRVRDERALQTDFVAVAATTVFVAGVGLAFRYYDAAAFLPPAVLLLLFAPGYVVAAGLFPKRGRTGGTKRVALSVGLCPAIVPLLGLGRSATPWDGRLGPIVLVAGAFALLVTAIAATRRRPRPESERFRIPYRERVESGRSGAFRFSTRREAVLTVLLVVSVLLVVGVVAYAAVTPQSESYSSIYLLTEDENGELVADDYPTQFVSGEKREVIVGIDNHEHRTTNYTVVIAEQEVDVSGAEPVVDEQRELDRFDARLEHGETRNWSVELEPAVTGSDVRIVWLLYLDEGVPDDPSVESADNYVSLWIDVTDEAED